MCHLLGHSNQNPNSKVLDDNYNIRAQLVGTGAASGSDIAQDLCGVASSVTVSIRTERWIMHRG